MVQFFFENTCNTNQCEYITLNVELSTDMSIKLKLNLTKLNQMAARERECHRSKNERIESNAAVHIGSMEENF